MRALESEVTNAVWEAVEALLPEREVNHPMGGHRPRIPDRLCFQGILIRLVTGCSWVSAEHLLGGAVSDTTLRARRDEWTDAGVFDAVVSEALAAYDRIMGFDLTEVLVDGSQHKAPSCGQGTGKNPCDRAKSGWKWSIATDANGIPVGWATDGANRHDSILFGPTLEAVADRGLLFDVETLHLDRGYDSKPVRVLCEAVRITDIICARKRPRGRTNDTKLPTPLGMRWTVERTNSWLSNYGQLRRNTDRHPHLSSVRDCGTDPRCSWVDPGPPALSNGQPIRWRKPGSAGQAGDCYSEPEAAYRAARFGSLIADGECQQITYLGW